MRRAFFFRPPAKLSRREVVRRSECAAFVRFKSNFLGQHDVACDQMINRYKAPASS